jgi:hypothetical protein
MSSLPTFFVSSLTIYVGLLEQEDKYKRYCLWRNKDLNKRNISLAAWEVVCKPKDKGD